MALIHGPRSIHSFHSAQRPLSPLMLSDPCRFAHSHVGS
jgi:hypothetical protein